MIKIFEQWIHRYFSDEEAIVLVLLLIGTFSVIIIFGSILAPVIAGIILAFVLQGVVTVLERMRVPHMLAVVLTFCLFLAVCMAVFLLMLPLVVEQGSNLANEVPRMLQRGQEMVKHLPDEYPGFITESQITAWNETAQEQLTRFGQWFVSFSLSKLPGVVGILIYMVLVPILVFFFLKDSALLKAWLSRMLPTERRMINQVSEEMSRQIANYIRGKVIEIVIVGVATFIALWLLGFPYSALLGLLVGLSVLIPYIGAAVVTIPVAAIGLFQWGFSHDFMIAMVIYGVIQALDGNVLVPLLFSEAVNLHPIAIIVAVLFFGGIWGFWGVFFAIPLATLIKAVVTAWPGADTSEVPA